MTYADSRTGSRTHIWDNDAQHPDRALCGVLAPYPYSASESDINEAEKNLCNDCERIRSKRIREGTY